jgi:hypothetical protein
MCHPSSSCTRPPPLGSTSPSQRRRSRPTPSRRCVFQRRRWGVIGLAPLCRVSTGPLVPRGLCEHHHAAAAWARRVAGAYAPAGPAPFPMPINPRPPSPSAAPALLGDPLTPTGAAARTHLSLSTLRWPTPGEAAGCRGRRGRRGRPVRHIEVPPGPSPPPRSASLLRNRRDPVGPAPCAPPKKGPSTRPPSTSRSGSPLSGRGRRRAPTGRTATAS